MKLIIQIPCFNEEQTLPAVIADLPKKIEGIDVIEYQVIDDGSSDRTSEVAKQLGVHHIISLGSNRGLAQAFYRGVEHALQQGADIVVNTDGDNQYSGHDIVKLVQPILANKADLVIGNRPIADHPEFGILKKVLQKLGSAVLRFISKTNVPDAPSGFRAFSRETCQRIFVYSRFSYCMETLIQAGTNGLRVLDVDINVNSKTRGSRLFKSITEYVWKTGSTMVAMFLLYRPMFFFNMLGSISLMLSLALGIRFIYLIYFLEHSSGVVQRTHLPSVILICLFGVIGVLLVIAGAISDLIKSQRRLTEELLYLQRRNH